MKSTIAVGLLLFVAFSIGFAPASLVQVLLPAHSGAELLAPAGTVWNGEADLFLGGAPAGNVHWRFRPGALTQGALGYDLTLGSAEHDVIGALLLGTGAASVELDGRASAVLANRWLAAYDITLAGDFALHGIHLHIPYNLRAPAPPTVGAAGAAAVGEAAGSLAWTGGPIQYRLAGQAFAASLPPLVAHLGDALEAVVYQEGGQTPLLRAELLDNGFARIGMTKLLTMLVGNPWPGSHAEHDVVLEVEELLF
jgi:hypothetical protein